MSLSPVIKFGSLLARDLSLTPEKFTAAIVWNMLPECVFFACIIPNTYDDIQSVLDRLEALGIQGKFQASDKTTEFILQKNFYKKRITLEGNIIWTK